MTVWMAFLILGLLREIPTTTSDNSCNVNKPSLFLDFNIGEDFIEDNALSAGEQFDIYPMPYRVFGIYGSATNATLEGHGSVKLSVVPNGGLGGLSVVPNYLSTDDYWYGRLYYRFTRASADLTKIDSFICDYHSDSALIFTYSCLSRDNQTFTAEANYQVVFSHGQMTGGTNQTILFIIYDFVPEETDAYIEYIGLRGRHPLSPSNDTILAIFVTTTYGFRNGVPPPIVSAPCPPPFPAPRVTCSLTEDRLLTTFDGQQVTVPQEKVTLAEWNPGANNCKFKFFANFRNFYRWTSFAVGPQTNPRKFFRFIDFNRPSGKISQRGWKCKTSCKGVIQSFDAVIATADGSTVYATVKEIDPDTVYTVETENCTAALGPDYKLTYDFGANSTQPLATLQLATGFHVTHKNKLTGLCVSSP